MNLTTPEKTPAEQLAELQQNGWSTEDALNKTFVFDSFEEATDFLATVGEVAGDWEVSPKGAVLQGSLLKVLMKGTDQDSIDLARMCDAIVEGAMADTIVAKAMNA